MVQISDAQAGKAQGVSALCSSDGWTGSDVAIDVLFWADILLTFRSGYIDDRQIIHMQPKDAAWKYLKSWFVVDLVSSFPFEAIVYGASCAEMLTREVGPDDICNMLEVFCSL